MDDLPPEVASLIDAVRLAGLRVERGQLQVMFWCAAGNGSWQKAGGWNTQKKHWYVSKVLASGQDQRLAQLGLQWEVNKHTGHCWWQIDGAENAGAFRAAIKALTGVAIPAGKTS